MPWSAIGWQAYTQHLPSAYMSSFLVNISIVKSHILPYIFSSDVAKLEASDETLYVNSSSSLKEINKQDDLHLSLLTYRNCSSLMIIQ